MKIPSLSGLNGSSAAQDLGLGADTMDKTAQELAEVKRRKKVLGQNPAMSPAVMSLTGNQY
jgi:hypothetical protein